MCYAIRTLINGVQSNLTIHDENSLAAMEPYITRVIKSLPHDEFTQVIVYRLSIVDSFSRSPDIAASSRIA